MPLIKSKSKKSDKKNEEMESDKSLALEFNVKKAAGKRKMSNGGVVKQKTVGEIIGYPGSSPVKKAHGGMIEPSMSIAQAIRAKKKQEEISPEDPLDQLEPEYDELNEEAGEESGPLEVSEGNDDYDKQNRIAAIRRKRLRG